MHSNLYEMRRRDWSRLYFSLIQLLYTIIINYRLYIIIYYVYTQQCILLVITRCTYYVYRFNKNEAVCTVDHLHETSSTASPPLLFLLSLISLSFFFLGGFRQSLGECYFFFHSDFISSEFFSRLTRPLCACPPPRTI